jgi:outer membrane protein
MKTSLSLFLISLLSISAMGIDSSPLLSNEKQNILKQNKIMYESEYEKLSTDWLAPLNLNGSYSYDKSAQGNYHSQTGTLWASISQDIFRSGGITYQIRYADTKKQLEATNHQKQIAFYHEQLFISLLNYRKNRILLEQSSKRLENKEIEIFIKRQLFENGKVDITELNSALVEKSGEQKNRASIEYSLTEQRYEIAKISDINPDIFNLPMFELIEKERYLSDQFDLAISRAQSNTLKNLYDITSSRYLPSLALNATYGYRDYEPKELSGAYRGDYYTAGVQLTMPLSYNGSATIQEAQANYLKEAAKTADKKRELNAQYALVFEKIQSYRDYISITSKNLLLYDELIRVLQAGVNAGTKTGYDLQTLKNTKTIEELEIKINEINIQIEFAKLHFALHPSKENL